MAQVSRYKRSGDPVRVPSSTEKTKVKTNFFDMPEDVRQMVYRLSLVRPGETDYKQFREDSCQNRLHRSRFYSCSCRGQSRKVPLLLATHKAVEKEASSVYFGANHFTVNGWNELHQFVQNIFPRHLKQIRSLSVLNRTNSGRWPNWDSNSAAVRTLSRFSNLQTLRISVDEEVLLASVIEKNDHIRWRKSLGFSQQLGLQLLRVEGMTALLSIRGIPKVEFITGMKRANDGKRKGAIKDGFLKTVIGPSMMRLDGDKDSSVDQSSFRLLDLPPELRNRIYREVLTVVGRVSPSNRPPASHEANERYKRLLHRKDKPFPPSVLALLCANRQVHDEALGIFYHDNDLNFYFPTNLQAFLLNLGDARQNAICSITLWYKDIADGGTSNMDIAVIMLRKLKGLRKFCLITEDRPITVQFIHSLPGVKAMFSLRGLEDIKIRHLDLEDTLRDGYKGPYAYGSIAVARKSEAILRHFNRALLLAQKGVDVHEVYSSTISWREGEFPKLEGSSCSVERGCSC